jgi:hypothetical protein
VFQFQADDGPRAGVRAMMPIEGRGVLMDYEKTGSQAVWANRSRGEEGTLGIWS